MHVLLWGKKPYEVVSVAHTEPFMFMCGVLSSVRVPSCCPYLPVCRVFGALVCDL